MRVCVFYLLNFFHVHECFCFNVCVHQLGVWYPQKTKEDIRCSATGAMDNFVPPC
uniref:Uncharacterized protein n=1 Tax=Mus musculus TaxID=10090 RepID=Q3T9Y6_MOUSE|nr:unnamed protein product [Mus musculus]